jgi:Lon protease-like protein
VRIALFPLNTVLFPGGVLPLRVFEARYMDMVRDCMREQQPFGVCLITQGAEVGQPARTEEVGCLAHIGDWDMQQLGVLNIRCRGGQRFRILDRAVEPNGLARARVELIDDDEDCPLAPEHASCADLLRRIIDDQRTQAALVAEQEGGEAAPGLPFDPPFQLDSSTWVGNRICEVLPVPLKAKQKLMELDDAHTRLAIITQYLKQHAVLK